MGTFDIKDSAKVTLITNASQNLMDFGKFFRAPIHLGIILAIISVIIIWFILEKTSLGYKLKAVGLNREASEYGGISANKK